MIFYIRKSSSMNPLSTAMVLMTISNHYVLRKVVYGYKTTCIYFNMMVILIVHISIYILITQKTVLFYTFITRCYYISNNFQKTFYFKRASFYYIFTEADVQLCCYVHTHVYFLFMYILEQWELRRYREEKNILFYLFSGNRNAYT